MLDSEGAGRVVTVKTGPLAETGFRKQFLHELSCIMPGPDELHQPPLDFLQGLSSRVPQPWASTGPPPAIPHAICVHLGWCGHAAAAAHGSLAGRWTWAYPCPPPWAYVCRDAVHRQELCRIRSRSCPLRMCTNLNCQCQRVALCVVTNPLPSVAARDCDHDSTASATTPPLSAKRTAMHMIQSRCDAALAPGFEGSGALALSRELGQSSDET